jgi:hypothetical protein
VLCEAIKEMGTMGFRLNSILRPLMAILYDVVVAVAIMPGLSQTVEESPSRRCQPLN